MDQPARSARQREVFIASVTFDRVTKRFGPLRAVDNLSLEILDTEFMVLVGPSGCGKSTALRMLAGLDEPTEGEIRIDDRVVNGVPPQERDIAMVFQSYALYPHMTVFDNLAFGLRMRCTPKRQIPQRVADAARILGLEELLARTPRQLSGGQRQRVAVGRAIVRDPAVFLLDEPLSNLDAKLRVQTRIELQSLHRHLGTTFIYVTHDQIEAMTMGDRIAVMRDGILQQVATPTEIYIRPVNLFVAGFIGSPTMNFLPVEIEGSVARHSTFELPLPESPGVERAILGVRPEALTRVDHGSLALEVDVVEVLGADVYVYGKVGGDSVTVRLDPAVPVAPGDRFNVGPVGRVHIFDAATEQAVLEFVL